MATSKSKSPAKFKSAAAVFACANRQEAQLAIKTLGDCQREHSRLLADMNDSLANITKAAAPALDSLSERMDLLQEGIRYWCEANREALCGNSKNANLVTGEVNWRQRPPSVSIKGQEAVLAMLEARGLSRFVRTKQEINKEAMLNEPAAVIGLPGVSINLGVEDFVITPFELDVGGE